MQFTIHLRPIHITASDMDDAHTKLEEYVIEPTDIIDMIPSDDEDLIMSSEHEKRREQNWNVNR
jgi:hypothetical protein